MIIERGRERERDKVRESNYGWTVVGLSSVCLQRCCFRFSKISPLWRFRALSKKKKNAFAAASPPIFVSLSLSLSRPFDIVLFVFHSLFFSSYSLVTFTQWVLQMAKWEMINTHSNENVICLYKYIEIVNKTVNILFLFNYTHTNTERESIVTSHPFQRSGLFE